MKPNSHHRSLIAARVTVALLAAGPACQALSDGHHAPLEEVVVFGTKIPRQLAGLTHSATVINADAIEQLAYTDVTEVLRRTTGIEFRQAGGVGQYNSTRLRGLSAANVLVLVDGVRINQGSSGHIGNLMGQLDPAMIETVEVLRGPQATLYGASATAGVIAITTRAGGERDGRVSLEAGSLGWRKGSLSARDRIALGNGHLSYAAHLSATESDGVHRHEFFEDRTAQLKLVYQQADWELGGSWFDTDNEFGYAELVEAWCCQTRGSFWAYQVPDPHAYNTTRQKVATVWGEAALTERLTQRLQLAYSANRTSTHDRDDGLLGIRTATVDEIVPGARAGDRLYIYDHNRGPDFNGISLSPLAVTPYEHLDSWYEDRSWQGDYQLHYHGDQIDWLVGAEYQRQKARNWGSYGAGADSDWVMSLYVNGDWRLFGDQLVVSAGARFDEYDSWGNETTGNLGVAWLLTPQLTLFGNVGTSFRAATLSQLFDPVYGDPTLAPESGITVEGGVRYISREERLSADVAVWRTAIDDVIFYDYSIPNPATFGGFGRYNNGAEAGTSGIEASWSLQLIDHLTLDGTYTYTDSKERPVNGDWTRSVQIARHKANLGLTWQTAWLTLGANLYYQSPRLRWAADVETVGYVRTDLAARYQLTPALSLSLRVENLFDRKIVEALGYEEPGRYTVVGLDYKFF
jgi:outer membrane cobalamin receptor